MRVRARRRLIGMVVLVGAGVVGFPWLFETQPRPMATDIQIVQAPQAGSGVGQGPASQARTSASAVGAMTGTSIAAVTSPTAPAQRMGSAPVGEPPVEREEFETAAPSRPAAVASVVAPAVPVAVSKPIPPKPTAPKPVVQAPPKASPSKPADKVVAKVPAKPAEKAAKAEPADKKEKAVAKPSTRYVVQFGAFSDVNSAHEARMKAERLGLKTYAQQVDTPQGKRIRVRLGPFTDKAEADKAAATLRKAALPGAVLTL